MGLLQHITRQLVTVNLPYLTAGVGGAREEVTSLFLSIFDNHLQTSGNIWV
jgi:hypothetical protein